jgi:hypothetical protein
VPAEILVYTETEWAQMAVQHRRLRREVDADGVWLTA